MTSLRILGFLVVFSVVYCKNPRQLDLKTEIDKVEELFTKDVRAHNHYSLGHDIYAQDFVRISPGSVIVGDSEALENLYNEHFNIDHYKEGPAHVVSACGNTSLEWREYSYMDDQGVVKKGTFVALYVFQDGKAKIKFFQCTV